MLAASLVSHSLALVLAKVLGILLAMLDLSVRWFAGWHGASYRIPGPPLLIIAFLPSWLSRSPPQFICDRWISDVFDHLHGSARHWPRSSPCTLFVRASRQTLELTVLDVGQGDSLFLSFPRGRTMLVDGGGEIGTFHSGGMRSGLDVGEDVVSPYLWSRGIKRIDVVALTHAHEDHLGGLAGHF